MSDEMANNPVEEIADASEVEVVETATEEVVSDSTADTEVEANEVETNETLTPEFVSVEYDGMEYEVPSNLKDALMRQSDYTQKTQTLAEQRKEVEQQAAQFQQQVELQKATFQDVAGLKAIEQQLEQYNALNWDQLYSEDMATAVNLDRQKRDLEGQRQDAINRLNENQTQVLDSQRAQHAKMVEEGQKVLKKEIDNWSPELASEISNYGISQGLTQQAVQNIVDPVHVKLLDKARRYDALVAKQKAAKPAPEQPASAVKVKGKRASASKDPDKLSTDEWLKMRNQQIKKRESA